MNSIYDFFIQGGWVMLLLVFESILGVAVIINLVSSLFFKPAFDKTSLFQISRKAAWLSYLASLSTMTGLLGTVLGIYHSFQNMKLQGKISLELFSSGISEALITTIYGLIISIIFIFFYHALSDKIEWLEENITKENQRN